MISENIEQESFKLNSQLATLNRSDLDLLELSPTYMDTLQYMQVTSIDSNCLHYPYVKYVFNSPGHDPKRLESNHYTFPTYLV
jgi:hypothetical protein